MGKSICRKRARKACMHCKRAKTSCGNERPCTRCVRLKLTDTCIDPPSSSTTTEDRELWEAALQFFVSSKKKQLTNSEQKIVSSVGNLTTKKQSSSYKKALEEENQRLQEANEKLQAQCARVQSLQNIFVDKISESNKIISQWKIPELTLVQYNNQFKSVMKETLNLQNFSQLHINDILTTQSRDQIENSTKFLLNDQNLLLQTVQSWTSPNGSISMTSEIRLLYDADNTPEFLLLVSVPIQDYPGETEVALALSGIKKSCESKQMEKTPTCILPSINIPKEPLLTPEFPPSFHHHHLPPLNLPKQPSSPMRFGSMHNKRLPAIAPLQ